MSKNFPTQRLTLARYFFGIDRNDDALSAKFFRCLTHELTIRNGRSVDRHFVSARFKQTANIFDRAHATADGQRHEAAFRCTFDDIENGLAIFVTGGDIEKA